MTAWAKQHQSTGTRLRTKNNKAHNERRRRANLPKMRRGLRAKGASQTRIRYTQKPSQRDL